MERYFSAGIGAATNRVYSTGIKKYLTMCHNLSMSPTPASEDILCKFVTHLALNNISANSIKMYLLGVRQLHVREGLPPPCTADMAKLAQVMRGIKLIQASKRPISQRKCLPITPEILCQVKG